MHVHTTYKIINLIYFWAGLSLLFQGFQKMSDSGYVAPKCPAGWISGMVWITAGGVVGGCWFTFMITHIIDQKCFGKPRWSTYKILVAGLPLLGAVCLAVAGTYVTWQHPYRLGECDCSLDEWGPNCLPCLCGDHGICDSGSFGTGQCICDFNWAGPKCDQCGDRWKGEDCDVCKTGYANAPRCNICDRGYDGEKCDVCADGWQPWQHSSEIFPNTISEDDNRHLCDECLPDHWGYYCKKCPIGNDVPLKTLDKSNPIKKGTRARDNNGNVGEIQDMQVFKNGAWHTQFAYDANDQKVLEHVRVRIRLDRDRTITNWILFEELRGVQCNNRGICNDDQKHQLENPDWQLTCTPTRETCTSNSDCTVSENCKGTCQGTELPINPIWAIQLPAGKLCSSDEDCIDRSIHIDETGATYEGGRCISRVCCKESYHGDGMCECDSNFFGRKDPDMVFDHAKTSPACDFCPGYDWNTEEPSSICSGGKGTCTPGYSRDDDYLNMRCTCGNTVYIDPITGILDQNKIIRWYGDLCQCGDWDEDLECDTCASGYWGPECQQCPGGFGLRACSGHGKCDGSGTNSGTGKCDCDTKEYTSWMLSPYVKRYPSEHVGYDSSGKDHTCSECAPNFWGQECLRCDETDMIKPSELKHIFQPGGSFSLGPGMSSADPIPVCHPEKPWICSLACGRGGWCNWGRTGDGTCMCWSNKVANPHTYNPLDNVCIGNDQYTGSLEDYLGYGEQCPSFGYCSLGKSGREDFTQCETSQDCSVSNLGECYQWLQVDFAPRTWGFSCTQN